VIVTARSAGRAIVQEAIARRSEVIVLGSQSKRRIADKVFGRTIDYVLDNLPCEAIINVIPKHVVTGAVGVGPGGAIVVTPAAAAQSAPTKRSTAVVSEAAEGAAGGTERLKRRAQGLRLGRYVSSQPVEVSASAGSAESGGDAAPPASPPQQAPPHTGKRDPGAA